MYSVEDAMPHAFLLPVELHHRIILLLDVSDIFSFRRTCKHFFMLTQGRSLWSMIFASLWAVQPLPCSRTEFMAMASSQAEYALLAASRVEASFFQLRKCLAHPIPITKQPFWSMGTSTCCWNVLAFISDRFVLSVDTIAVSVWDTITLASSSPAVASSPWVRFVSSNFLGYVDCNSVLYIAIGYVCSNRQSVAIYSLCLPPFGRIERSYGRFHREAEFLLLENEALKDMDPHTGRALLYLPPDSIRILEWHDGGRKSTVSLQPDELNHHVGIKVMYLRFCGPCILCFRSRSVEVYPIPTDIPTTGHLPILRYRFEPACFRDMSFSHVRVSHRPSGDIYTIYMLTNDVHEGMFHYRIRITTSPVLAMSVHILAKGSVCPSGLPPCVPGMAMNYMLENSIRHAHVFTWSLGSMGLRGAWVDRQRGSIDQRVVGFTTQLHRLRTIPGDDLAEGKGKDVLEEPPMMDGKVVHVNSSCNVRDDIAICAVSEWTGRIALGSCIGTLSLL